MNWISVKDRIPSDCQEVMFFYLIRGMNNQTIKKDIVCGHLDKGIWHICYLFISMPLNDAVEVTHWMDLPEYPK